MYQLNKDYIAKNLCENRSKPQLKCNGKCHLRKQLKKANQQQEKQQKQQQEEIAIAAVYLLPASWQMNVTLTDFSLKHNEFYSAPQGISFSADIFHPPQA